MAYLESRKSRWKMHCQTKSIYSLSRSAVASISPHSTPPLNLTTNAWSSSRFDNSNTLTCARKQAFTSCKSLRTYCLSRSVAGRHSILPKFSSRSIAGIRRSPFELLKTSGQPRDSVRPRQPTSTPSDASASICGKSKISRPLRFHQVGRLLKPAPASPSQLYDLSTTLRSQRNSIRFLRLSLTSSLSETCFKLRGLH